MQMEAILYKFKAERMRQSERHPATDKRQTD
nr:MAG TPA: hypothetical protein [Caudoviricetes sp.]